MPLTRPAPAGESAGSGPPSSARGEGLEIPKRGSGFRNEVWIPRYSLDHSPLPSRERVPEERGRVRGVLQLFLGHAVNASVPANDGHRAVPGH